MPRKPKDPSTVWKIRGHRVGVIRNGTYCIDRQIAGRRVVISTGCVTRAAAAAEYARFEVNPAAFISRGGRRALAPKTAADPARSARLRDNHLRRKYRVEPSEYQALLVAQGERCAICGCHVTEAGGVFDVDHCHVTGKVRGLLCGPCNRGIGQLGDSPDRLRKALSYLESAPTP